jgi:hypothetical protein
MKVVRLSTQCTGHLYTPGNIPDAYFCKRLSQPQGHSGANRIMSMKTSSDTKGNRTCNLPTCSTAPPPTALPSTSKEQWSFLKNSVNKPCLNFKQHDIWLLHSQSLFLDVIVRNFYSDANFILYNVLMIHFKIILPWTHTDCPCDLFQCLMTRVLQAFLASIHACSCPAHFSLSS